MSNQGRKAWRFVIFFSRFITTFLQQGFIKSLGVLIPSLVDRFGSTYATIGFLASLQYALLLVSCPFVKVLSQRIDSRLLSLCGGLVAGISIISAAFVDSAVAFGLLLGLSGVMSSTVYQTCNVMLRMYFKEDYPTANAMAMTGALLGGITLPPIVSSLLASFGTSGAIWILGALFLHYVPAAVTLRPNHPARTIQPTEETDEAPLSNGQQRHETSNCCCHGNHNTSTLRICDFRTLRKEKLYCIFIFPSIFLHQMIYIGWVLYMVSFAHERGLSDRVVAYIPLTGAMGGLVGRLFAALATNKCPDRSNIILVINSMTTVIALFIYPTHSTLQHQLVCSFFTGFGAFATSAMFYAIMAESTDEESFPEIIALNSFVRGLAVITSSYTTGAIAEGTGSFAISFRVLGALGLVVVSLVLAFSLIQARHDTESSTQSPGTPAAETNGYGATCIQMTEKRTVKDTNRRTVSADLETNGYGATFVEMNALKEQ